MTDLVNKILMESDERLRGIDDLRYQLEMKDKLKLMAGGRDAAAKE